MLKYASNSTIVQYPHGTIYLDHTITQFPLKLLEKNVKPAFLVASSNFRHVTNFPAEEGNLLSGRQPVEDKEVP